MAWLFGSVGRCVCGVVAPRRSTFNGEPICGPCAKTRRSARRRTRREVHESITGLTSGPRLTPTQQAEKKNWLKQNALRDRDTRRALAGQQDGWSGDDDDPCGATAALPLPPDLEHDKECQERIAHEVAHFDRSGLISPPRAEVYVDAYGDDTRAPDVTPHAHALVRKRVESESKQPRLSADVVPKKGDSLADCHRKFLLRRKKDLTPEQREAIEVEIARLGEIV